MQSRQASRQTSWMEHVARYKYRDETRTHEGGGRNQGPRRQARQPAYAVSTSAAGAITAADANEQARYDKDNVPRIHAQCGHGTKQLIEQRRSDQAQYEGNTPSHILPAGPQQS